MDKMKELVDGLLSTESLPVPFLQRINEALLKEYRLSAGGFLTVLPKEVEIYYVNKEGAAPYVDTNMHCMLDPRTNDEIWGLQAGRFGQVYCHRKGLGGLDVCLSDSDDYALCCTIKAAEINGEECWSPLKVRNTVLDKICEHDGTDRAIVMERMNEKRSMTFLSRREYPLTDDVYHLHRKGLRRRDKYARLPLRSFTDLWNNKLQINRIQKVSLYMNAHPGENVLDVLRQHGFRYIPLEIRIRYKIDNRIKLYE